MEETYGEDCSVNIILNTAERRCQRCHFRTCFDVWVIIRNDNTQNIWITATNAFLKYLSPSLPKLYKTGTTKGFQLRSFETSRLWSLSSKPPTQLVSSSDSTSHTSSFITYINYSGLSRAVTAWRLCQKTLKSAFELVCTWASLMSGFGPVSDRDKARTWVSCTPSFRENLCWGLWTHPWITNKSQNYAFQNKWMSEPTSCSFQIWLKIRHPRKLRNIILVTWLIIVLILLF